MKKMLALVLTAFMVILFMVPANAEEPFVIGICQHMHHEALDAATEGFMDAITEKLGKDGVVFDYENASGDSNTCATIINGFVSRDVDLILANATPALLVASQGVFEIPVLGTAVTEYGVALGIDDFDGISGYNISGTSDFAPLDKQADMLMDLFPEAKQVGMLYCSSEPNSEYQVKIIRDILEENGFFCTDYPFFDSNDIASVTTVACENSDIIYIPTDNTAASCTGIIDSVCRAAGVPVVGGDEGIMKGCGTATLCISYYNLGRITGEMALRILVDGEDIAQMPIEYDMDYVAKYNPETCELYGIDIPEEYIAIG